MTPGQQQRAELSNQAKGNALRLWDGIDAMSRLEAKLREADAALSNAEQALWGASFERSTTDHQLRSDTPSPVSYLPEQQQIILMRSKIAQDIEALIETKKAAYAEISAYRNVQGTK